MTTILIGITFVILGLVFNRSGNNHLDAPEWYNELTKEVIYEDVSQYYMTATVAYFAGIILIQMGAILMMLKYTSGV